MKTHAQIKTLEDLEALPLSEVHTLAYKILDDIDHQQSRPETQAFIALAEIMYNIGIHHGLTDTDE